MKTLLAALLAVVVSSATQAANIVIKNDTFNSPKIEVFQDTKRVVNVQNFRPGNTIVVHVNEAGKKPLLVITQFHRHTSLFLPIKSQPLFFQFSWLESVAQ